jgi:hypothetical protein
VNLLRRLERLEKNLVVIAEPEPQPPPRSALEEVKFRTLTSGWVTTQEIEFMRHTLEAQMAAEAQGLSFDYPVEYKALLVRLDEALEVTALESTGRTWAALVEEERQRHAHGRTAKAKPKSALRAADCVLDHGAKASNQRTDSPA